MNSKILYIMASLLVLMMLGTTELYAQSEAKKDTIVVFPFGVDDGADAATATTLTREFEGKLFETQRYHIIARTEIERVMSELRFSMSDIADQSKALEVGKQLSANKMVVGDIGRVNSLLTLNVRLIDVETSSLEEQESLRTRKGLEDMYEQLEVLAQKFAGTYKKKKRWLYVVGVAVIGAATALVLLQDDGGSEGLPLPPSPPN